MSPDTFDTVVEATMAAKTCPVTITSFGGTNCTPHRLSRQGSQTNLLRLLMGQASMRPTGDEIRISGETKVKSHRACSLVETFKVGGEGFTNIRAPSPMKI